VVEPLTAAAALAVWASLGGATRLPLRRSPRWAEAMAALNAILPDARRRAAEAARDAYRQARTDALPTIPEALRRTPDDDAEALAVEASPFGDGRLVDLIDEAKRALERAALGPDAPGAIGRWLADYRVRFARAIDGLTGDHATAAALRAPLDLIDPRFLD
jgi:hypothetical protein